MKGKSFIKAEKLPDGQVKTNIDGAGGTVLELLNAINRSVALIMLQAGNTPQTTAQTIAQVAGAGYSMAEQAFKGKGGGGQTTETVQLGYTLPPERWHQAAATLQEAAPYLAANLERFNSDGRGKEDADDFTADMALACMALHYVADNAADRCRFIPISGGAGK